MNTFGAAIQDAGVFQFLIGTVLHRKYNKFKISFVSAMFQFLIGTVLPAAEANRAQAELKRFQFLIGTVLQFKNSLEKSYLYI